MRAPHFLPPPYEATVVLGAPYAEEVLELSRVSPRKRMMLPFHKGNQEAVHKVFHAIQPGTYLQPQRRLSEDATSAFVVLGGAMDFVTFDAHGTVTHVYTLTANGTEFGLDIPLAGVFHTVLARARDTLVYEVRAPSRDEEDRELAAWAPAEGLPESKCYLAQLEQRIAKIKRAQVPASAI